MGKSIPSWAKVPHEGNGLVLVARSAQGKTKHRLDELAGYRIGRNDKEVEIICEERTCSRVHACIAHHPSGKVFIVDLDSAHGTVVDGIELEKGGRAELIPGRTRFYLGSDSWIFSIDQEASPSKRLMVPTKSSRADRSEEHDIRQDNERHHERKRAHPDEGYSRRHSRHLGRDDRGGARAEQQHRPEPRRPDRSRQDDISESDARRRRHSDPAALRRDPDPTGPALSGQGIRHQGVAQSFPASVEQKKALLWGNKSTSQPKPMTISENSTFGANRWDTANFTNESDRAKFNKLMGVKSQDQGPAFQGGEEREREVLTGDAQTKVLTEVESHFMQGLRRADGRKVGLGL